MDKKVFLKSESETLAFAADFAKQLVAPKLIALHGDLGAGKTTFVRGVIQALCGTIPVPSPTFTLIQTYDTPKGLIAHLDLYRVTDPSEVQELGLEEMIDQSIVFVEWPEKSDLPSNKLNFYFKRTEKGLEITQS